MIVKKAILRSFNSENYTATIEISGSGNTYLEDVPVARNLPAPEMSAGSNLVVIFFDAHNVKDAVVMAVYQ
jgi:hypothetical protein